MSTLFVFLLQLLQATGFPIDIHTGVVIGTPSAPRLPATTRCIGTVPATSRTA